MAIYRGFVETRGHKVALPALIERRDATDAATAFALLSGYDRDELFLDRVANDRPDLVSQLMAECQRVQFTIDRLNAQRPLPEWEMAAAVTKLAHLVAQMEYVVTALGFYEQHVCSHYHLADPDDTGCWDAPTQRILPQSDYDRALPGSRLWVFCDRHIEQYEIRMGGVYAPNTQQDYWGYPQVAA
jgi:hypothetical protein